MESIFVSPGKYFQGPGILSKIGILCNNLGNKCILLGDKTVLDIISGTVKNSLEKVQIESTIEEFNGECTKKEIYNLSEIAKKSSANFIIAAGGGKSLDTGKAIASQLNIDCVIVPTIAATDAPTSSVAVLYNEKHVYDGVMKFNRNPSIVIVDSEIISKAPSRYLVSGMGDALATKFEANACFLSGAKNCHGYNSTVAGLKLANLCFETILENGVMAKISNEKGIVTTYLEKVIEANILLSGLGWENCGEALAHAFDGAITNISKTKSKFHGERVAVGLLIQLIIEDMKLSEILNIVNFYKKVNLPITLEDLGVNINSKSEIEVFIKNLFREGSYIYNMPFNITKNDIINAIKFLDVLKNIN